MIKKRSRGRRSGRRIGRYHAGTVPEGTESSLDVFPPEDVKTFRITVREHERNALGSPSQKGKGKAPPEDS